MFDAGEGVAMSDDEMASRLQRGQQMPNDPLLGRRVEIDEHIAEQYHVEPPEIGERLVEIRVFESDALTEAARHLELSGLRPMTLETKSSQVLLRDVLRTAEIISAAAGGLENA